MSCRLVPYREPLDLLADFADERGAVLLDSAVPGDPRSRWSILARRPRRMVEERSGTVFIGGKVVDGDLPAALRTLIAQGAVRADSPSPFSGGLIGFIGYEAARRIATGRAPVSRDDGGCSTSPDAWFALYDTVAVFDTVDRRAWCVGPDASELAAALAAIPPPAPLSAETGAWTSSPDRAEAERRIERVIALIEAGDLYQANITQRWTGRRPSALSPYDLYRRLRAGAPGPFSAFLNTGPLQLASVSPERFVSLDASGEVETRPIKGTRPRHADPQHDAALARELAASAKDRAENLMIADLMRNDLSRVCVPGSVKTPVLCGWERFPGAHHLVSVVQGRLAPGRDALDLLAAALPGGSITGAPKLKAMQVIEAVEASPRGPYCGSLMWIGVDGAMDSSILIRTLVIEGERVTAQAGGGIVAESDPAAEGEEALVKVRPLLAALTRAP